MVRRHFFLVDDSAFIEEALVARVNDYRKGRGVQRLKRLLQPAFHRERIAGYGRQMVAATLEHIAGWTDDTGLEIDAEMTALTLTIAARMLCPTEVAERSATIRATLTDVMRSFPASLSPLSELLDALPFLPATRCSGRARAALDAVIYAIIAARRAGPEATRGDSLDMLLAAAFGRSRPAAKPNGRCRLRRVMTSGMIPRLCSFSTSSFSHQKRVPARPVTVAIRMPSGLV